MVMMIIFVYLIIVGSKLDNELPVITEWKSDFVPSNKVIRGAGIITQQFNTIH